MIFNVIFNFFLDHVCQVHLIWIFRTPPELPKSQGLQILLCLTVPNSLNPPLMKTVSLAVWSKMSTFCASFPLVHLMHYFSCHHRYKYPPSPGTSCTHRLWCGHPGSWSCQKGSRQCSNMCCHGSACWSWMAGSWRFGGFRWGGRGGCPVHRRSPPQWPDTTAARQAVHPQQDREPRSLWCWQILPLAEMHWQSIDWNVDLHWKLWKQKQTW